MTAWLADVEGEGVAVCDAVRRTGCWGGCVSHVIGDVENACREIRDELNVPFNWVINY